MKSSFFPVQYLPIELKVSLSKISVISVVLSILFLPALRIGNLGVRLDDIVLIFLTPFIILTVRTVASSIYNGMMLVLFFLLIFSQNYGYAFLDVPPYQGDTNEIIRLMKPLLFAILLFYINNDILEGIVYKSLYYGSIYIIFIGFFQYFNILGLGEWLSNVYASDSQIDTATAAINRRVTLTGSGPNDGAVIATYFLIFHYINYILSKHVFSLVASILISATILFTSSRTVFLGVIVSLAVHMIISSKISLSKKFIFYGLITVIIIYLIPKFQYIQIGLEQAIAGENNSLIVRLDGWKNAFELFKLSPWFGWGPAKAIHPTIIDGEYFLILRRYGVLGFLLILSIITYPLYFLIKKWKRLNERGRFYATILLCYMPIALSVMATNNFFSSYQAFLPYTMLTVLMIRNIEKTKNE